MNKKHIFYCFLLALLVTGLYNIFMPRTAIQPEQHLKVGQITEKDIIAPYDFQILRSNKQLDKERENIIKTTKPVYIQSDEMQFNAIQMLNEIFLPLLDPFVNYDTVYIKNSFRAHGVLLSEKNAKQLLNSIISKKIYDLLQEELNLVYSNGIYDEITNDSINVFVDGEIKNKAKTELLSQKESISKIINSVNNQSVISVLNEILPVLVKPNLKKDQEKFNELVELSFSKIPKYSGKITKNEIIVRSNSRITEEDFIKLQSLVSLENEKDQPPNTLKSLSVNISFFLYFFIIGMMLLLYYRLYYIDLLDRQYHFSPLIAGLAINAMLAILNNQIIGLQTLLIPYSLTVIVTAIIIDIPFAMFYNFLSFASIYPFVNWETFSPLVLVLATSGVILQIGRLNDKHQYFTIWLYLVLTTAILTLIFALYKADPLMVIIGNIGYAFISSTLSIILMLFIVPFIEKKWNLATKQELLELLDFNHPLLKKLATDAVGTYYHSLIVGNLAERAAEVIGANSLLARVGSYYHDIGKVVNPEFFTENNPDSASIHEYLTPVESATRIKNHVEEGIKLARHHRIPLLIIDIINQHHGTGYIRYFLDKAEKSRIPIDLDQYRYEGPKPRSKEAALVMIADIVESIAKSWDDINPEDIRKILNDTIFRLIKEGQFDDSAITMSDLTKVKDCMIPILESIYRKRQQYPEEESQF